MANQRACLPSARLIRWNVLAMRVFCMLGCISFADACLLSAEPIFEARLDYVGLWEGQDTRLLITRDSGVQYERRDQRSSRVLRGSIQSWQANGFSVGFFPFRTAFEIHKAPQQIAGQWRMTVDGVELHKVESSGFIGDLADSPHEEVELPAEGPPSRLLHGEPDLLGTWEAPEMRLVIRRDGWLSLHRIHGGGSPSLAAPIVSLSPDVIVAGAGKLRVSLRIDSGPTLAGQDWKMTVDGVELHRSSETHQPRASDFPLDRIALRERCSADDLMSCNNLGAFYEDGVGGEKDARKAAELYSLACEGKVALACANLGKLYFEGLGVAQDRATAIQLFERACDSGGAAGCFALGKVYDDGVAVVEDNAAAAHLLAKGCEGNVPSSCARLGAMYTGAEGLPRDYGLAFRLYVKACGAGDAFGCANLGGLYANGLGVQRDLDMAAVLLEEACGRGDAESCGPAAKLRAR